MPLSFLELEAWARCKGVWLQPWEFLMLRRLSIEWISESRRAEDEGCPAPWDAPVSEEELRAVAQSLRAELKGMAA